MQIAFYKTKSCFLLYISHIELTGWKLALFGGKTTLDIKTKFHFSDNRALGDFLPAITIKAKYSDGIH